MNQVLPTLAVIVALIAVGVVIQDSGITGAAVGIPTKRVLITPYDSSDLPQLKAAVSVQHEFSGKFSPDHNCIGKSNLDEFEASNNCLPDGTCSG